MPIGEDDIQAYVDGRLTPDRARLVEDYLARRPEEKARLEGLQADVKNLRLRLQPVFDEPIPSRLRIAALKIDMRRRRFGQIRRAVAAIVLVAIGAAGGWLFKPSDPGPSGRSYQIAVAAEDAYRTFVVEVMHPVEVGADNEEHLVQWLSKRTGAQLVPPDLGGFGYKLVGGRILPALGATAAQLMYETDAGERLTVYLRPGESGQTAFTFRQDGDVSNFIWVDNGFDFAVTAGLDRARLLPIATSIYENLNKTILRKNNA